MIVSLQAKVTSFASELEVTNQKTETRCTNIRKEVSKALSEQRQLLTSQADAMSKKMDSVAAKVLPICVCLPICLSLPASACLPACLLVCLSVFLSICLFVCLLGDEENQNPELLPKNMMFWFLLQTTYLCMHSPAAPLCQLGLNPACNMSGTAPSKNLLQTSCQFWQ